MLKIGHRGAPAYTPENTITSFQRAITLGADGIELDVHACKSGELVVIHDETVERTTNGKGLVSALTLTEIRALVVTGGEHIPTLSEVMETLGNKLYYFIEVKKAEDVLSTAALIEQFIKQGWQATHLMMISFQHEALIGAKQAFPEISIGASFEELTSSSVTQAQAMKANAILPHHKSLTQAYIDEAHKAGLKVIPWTVNNPEDIMKLRALGVDGIISDYPDRLN